MTTASGFSWSGKTVAVTGGTGTFGQAFTRYLLEKEGVSSVRVFSRDELKQWQMSRTLPDDRLRFLIGDVRDQERLHRAFDGVDVVVHAAALKQVPACEYNPFEAVKTNILGAENVINAAIERRVERVIALSTDKAANPVNLYGATKLCAEKLFVQGNAYVGNRPTALACVRYGNVAASRGSVIPLFIEQRASGRLTITDQRMTRFWITVAQAVEFVRHAVNVMAGGEIFVPKLPSVRIVDLASIVAPSAKIDEIGIRAGEKLHETLVTEEEARHAVDLGWAYNVLPEHAIAPRSTGSTRLPDGFRYSSDRNERWIDREELSRFLAEALAEAQHYEQGVASRVDRLAES